MIGYFTPLPDYSKFIVFIPHSSPSLQRRFKCDFSKKSPHARHRHVIDDCNCFDIMSSSPIDGSNVPASYLIYPTLHGKCGQYTPARITGDPCVLSSNTNSKLVKAFTCKTKIEKQINKLFCIVPTYKHYKVTLSYVIDICGLNMYTYLY